MNKRVPALILSLIFFFTPVLLSICSAVELPLTAKGSSPHSYEGGHPSYHQTTSHHKVVCPDNLNHCCNLFTGSMIFYLNSLDSYLLAPVRIFFRPSETAKFFYHPPKVLA
jgi:hypothetical protein